MAPLPDIVTIELPLDAYVPPDYIEDAELRFRLYRRMAALPSLESIDEMAAELADRFGPIPDAVDSLLYQLRVRLLASRAKVLSVVTLNQQISIRMEGLEETDRQALQRYLGPDVRVSRKAVWLRPEEKEPARLWWQVRLVQVLERLADWPG
jgi:transcription-repair coupling factor (superfamily II helicase)